MPPRSNTTVRDRNRKLIARGKPPCHLCGREIDYTAHYLHPLAFQVDHIVPLNQGGADDFDNLAASHRKCNRAKWDCRQKRAVRRPFITRRAWTST